MDLFAMVYLFQQEQLIVQVRYQVQQRQEQHHQAVVQVIMEVTITAVVLVAVLVHLAVDLYKCHLTPQTFRRIMQKPFKFRLQVQRRT
jgi:hypothetical protein